MLGLIALAGFLMGGFVLAAILGVAMFALKVVFWAIFLPFRIVTKVLFKVVFPVLMIPIWLTLGAIGMAAGAVALPVVLLIAAGVAVFALLLPLLPFVMLGLIVWAFTRRGPVPA